MSVTLGSFLVTKNKKVPNLEAFGEVLIVDLGVKGHAVLLTQTGRAHHMEPERGEEE